LGVYFGNNKEGCEKLNWENKIDKNEYFILLLGKTKFNYSWENYDY
jgi:hypothetical protein